MNQIFLVSVEASRAEHEIWGKLSKSTEDGLGEMLTPLGRRGLTRFDRDIEDSTWVLFISLFSVLFDIARSWVKDLAIFRETTVIFTAALLLLAH